MGTEEITGECIEFRIHDAQRFAMLVRVFEALKAAKQDAGPAPEPEDAYWLGFFDEQALSSFWWPTEAERQEHIRRWFATPVKKRHRAPDLQMPWDFASMVEAFYNGDYDLIACHRVGGDLGRLEFDPLGWPYGGTGCMRALLEAFGFKIVREVDLE